MSLSQNIKRLRSERNLTQEQLASALGVSAQAVSKWETSETYPDGALLVPLAEALAVSLDELFGHDAASMPDLTKRIIRLIHKTEESERFHLVRDICWQIEKGLFDCRMDIDKEYDPNELRRRHESSYILDDYGFTVVSNGKEPFFAVFPEPADGFGDFLDETENLQKIFSALSAPNTLRALIYLYQQPQNYLFEGALLAKVCNIAEDALGKVLEDLLLLQLVTKRELSVNGVTRILYNSYPSHKLIALFLMAREFKHKYGYCLQGDNRNQPLLKA
ncbi:MAG: helix-turn-helix domain-containing protein [Clostridia bacterium]|nr:helix-turn-helix domain-containing protein [Clostridia bacterium]